MYVCSIGGSDKSNKRREIDDECIRRAGLYVVHSKEVARNDQSPDVWEAAQKGIIQHGTTIVETFRISSRAKSGAGPARIRLRFSITIRARAPNSPPWDPLC